ncbi:hypothetical protein SELMODRAFT_418165 [Selaginella moellendorffii]|uniref:Pre-mRNA-splicing factor Syf1/CRNKL1-like C-terminal HAT-repeats domain-containing protein n=1 Tax=Selaginella moellendorffii TaxID=88036 RepID=D8S4W1_SELML|nr:protein high chlorophyll fluorescent 107 [Selaginella moellendorffii]EFJ20496.1 hypothetical protein SELMODRAFT_418165 [Selaginella moellendorffii]|eukprot:XP_002978510.1 protein high chlorophyll fluorescent 107 [Selaginella moellendorffii]
MAVAFLQHSNSIALRLSSASTASLGSSPSSRKPAFLGGLRFESSSSLQPHAISSSSSSSTSSISAGDEALEAHVRNGDSSEEVVAVPEESSESEPEEEPSISSDDVRVVQEIGAASRAPVVPGRIYGRLKINLDLLLYKAKLAQRTKKKFMAEAILRECIRDWADDGRAYVALGTSLVKSGKIKEARKLYEDGCQACRGENPYIWQALAVLEERSGNVSRARTLFDAATVADKKHAAAWHGWAVLELRNGSMRKARALLLKGLKFCGPNEYLYQTLAIIEVRMGEIEQARTYFTKATQANSKSAASWLAWALMEAEYGIKASVRQLFQRGLQAVPRNGHIWQAWARFEAKEGNKGRARHLFQRGMELNPKDVVLLQAFALFEYDCGQPDIARRHFRRAVLIDAKHQPLWLAWGWVEWKEGNLDSARDYYQKSLAVSNRNLNAVKTYQAWGVLEGKDENYGAARALFRSALRLDSQNMPAWLSWAAMEERCGNAVRAEELRTQCLQQRTEVVEEAPWDVNISEFLAPTIEGLAGILDPAEKRKTNPPDIAQELGSADKDFDIDGFLAEKFPWKYKPPQQQRSPIAPKNLTNKP